MIIGEIVQKGEKKTVRRSKTCWKGIHAPRIIIILKTKNDSDKITMVGLLHTFEKIPPYNFYKTGNPKTLDLISKCLKQIFPL